MTERGGGAGKGGGSARKHRRGSKAKVHPGVQHDFAAQTAHLPIHMRLTLSQLYLVLIVMNATKQPETHYYLPPWVPHEQILCAEYRATVLDNNGQHSELVSEAKLSSKTEPASEPPVKALGTTAAEAAVVECKDEASDDKHTTISAKVNVSAATASSKTEPASEPPVEALGTTAAEAVVDVECKDEESDEKPTTISAMVSVSAATACEHPVTPEGDFTLALNQAFADCKATTTTGESVVVMTPTGQPCNQRTQTGEAAFDIRDAPSEVEKVSMWEYNPARWVIRLLIGYMFISNLMLMQQHMC
jgi:hypothetical protein